MNELSVVICDDEATAISIVSASVEALFTSRGINVHMQTFQSAKNCLSWMKENHTDLAFLDIAMPEEDGLDLGRRLRELPQAEDLEIVIVSSNQNRVFEAFSIRVFGFVRKDQFMKDISEVITRYIETKQPKKKESKRLELRDANGSAVVDADAVTYIESYRNTQKVYLKDGEKVSMRTTMEHVLEQLAGLGFVRIHKGYIVNCAYIKKFNKNEVILHSGEHLPVGRVYHGQAAEAFMTYIRLHGVLEIA